MEELNEVEYTSTQRAVGELFYIFTMIACIGILVGVVWSILDFIMPAGKFDLFLNLNLGYQIVIVAAILAVVFFMLIFFFGLFKKGSKGLVKMIFRERALEERYKNRIDVKIVAGGLLLSIIALIIGAIWAVINDLFLDGSGTSPLSSLIAEFSAGNWILFGSVGLMAIVVVCLFMIYFWKNAYYSILRIMGILEKE
jgi:hypothetical protein